MRKKFSLELYDRIRSLISSIELSVLAVQIGVDTMLSFQTGKSLKHQYIFLMLHHVLHLQCGEEHVGLNLNFNAQ